MATGAIEMGQDGSQAETLSCCGRNETIELCDAVGIEYLQGLSQRVIIELLGGRYVGRSVYAGKIGHQTEGLIEKAQTIEHHRLDSMASCHYAHLGGWLSSPVNDFPDTEFVKHARNRTKIIQDSTAVGV
jgi:hypothetical protein